MADLTQKKFIFDESGTIIGKDTPTGPVIWRKPEVVNLEDQLTGASSGLYATDPKTAMSLLSEEELAELRERVWQEEEEFAKKQQEKAKEQARLDYVREQRQAARAALTGSKPDSQEGVTVVKADGTTTIYREGKIYKTIPAETTAALIRYLNLTAKWLAICLVIIGTTLGLALTGELIWYLVAGIF